MAGTLSGSTTVGCRLCCAFSIISSCLCLGLGMREQGRIPRTIYFALGIAASIVRHGETSRMVRRAARVLIPLSVVAIP